MLIIDMRELVSMRERIETEMRLRKHDGWATSDVVETVNENHSNCPYPHSISIINIVVETERTHMESSPLLHRSQPKWSSTEVSVLWVCTYLMGRTCSQPWQRSNLANLQSFSQSLQLEAAYLMCIWRFLFFFLFLVFWGTPGDAQQLLLAVLWEL